MSVALFQQLRFAIGFKQQSDLETPLVAADMVSLRLTNTESLQSTPINQDDAEDLGKGVYIERLFPSHKEAGGPFNGRFASQPLGIIAAFAAGNATKSAAGSGWQYVSKAPDLAVQGLELPSTTMLVQCADVYDKALIGVVCDKWGINVNREPGRDSATFSSTWKGTGRDARPSGILMPNIYDEVSMNAGDITVLSFCGFDYLANKRFVDLSFEWDNRSKRGFFPGSGSQDGFQVEGRKRRGRPVFTLKARVECDSGSNEEDLLLDQTEGTGEIRFVGGAVDSSNNHGFRLQFPRVAVKASRFAEEDDIAIWDLEYTAMRDEGTGEVVIATTVTDINNILAVAA